MLLHRPAPNFIMLLALLHKPIMPLVVSGLYIPEMQVHCFVTLSRTHTALASSTLPWGYDTGKVLPFYNNLHTITLPWGYDTGKVLPFYNNVHTIGQYSFPSSSPSPSPSTSLSLYGELPVQWNYALQSCPLHYL